MIASRPTLHDPSRTVAKPSSAVSASQLVVSERAPSVATVPQRRFDVFANPTPKRDYLIEFSIPEFTCNCPLTGQPDFASFRIEMVCDALCIELKSLKLYMWSYRNEGAFHEKVTNAILDDLVAAAKPRYSRIEARWNVRGGIGTNIVAEYRKKGWKGRGPAPVGAVPLPTMTL